MPVPALPTEVISEILTLVKRDDLTKACATTRRLYAIAAHILYQKPYLSTPREIVCCCRTLVSNALLAQSVSTLDIHISSPRTQESFFPALVFLVKRALKAAPRIRELRLRFMQNYEWLLDDLYFPRLQGFVSGARITNITSRFLARHPTITRLLLTSELRKSVPVDEQFALDASALPVLRTFTGPSVLAKFIVPGSPVDICGLSWGSRTPSDEDIYEAFEAVSRSAATVVTFDALTTSWKEAFLDAAAKYLPNLASFGLSKDNPYERLLEIDDGEEFDSFLKCVPTYLHKFDNILETNFTGGTSYLYEASTTRQVQTEAILVHEWAAMYPKLRSILLPSGLGWRPITHGIWMPNPGDPRSKKWIWRMVKVLMQEGMAKIASRDASENDLAITTAKAQDTLECIGNALLTAAGYTIEQDDEAGKWWEREDEDEDDSQSEEDEEDWEGSNSSRDEDSGESSEEED